MSSQARILIVDDELPMRTALDDCLAAEGYRTLTAADGETALTQARAQKPDLVLLDVMMPKLDGYSVCAALRKVGESMPILMLTAKGRIEDRVAGLDAGADDYLVKPFSTQELLARVRALLRRTGTNKESTTQLQLGDTQIDFARNTITRAGKQIHLTAKAQKMLRLLADAQGATVTREQFLDTVWGYGAFPTTRTVDNHIAKLRAALEPDPASPRYIKTIQGAGYRLEVTNP